MSAFCSLNNATESVGFQGILFFHVFLMPVTLYSCQWTSIGTLKTSENANRCQLMYSNITGFLCCSVFINTPLSHFETKSVLIAVSYTHLDVYKRQHAFLCE